MFSAVDPLLAARRLTLAGGCLLAAFACDPPPPEVDGGADAGLDTDAGSPPDAGPLVDAGPFSVPESYEYESRAGSGSSVSHSGQSARQVLMLDLAAHVRGLDSAVVGGEGPFSDGVDDGEVLEQLEYFFSLDAADRSSDPIRLTTTPSALQATYGEVSGSAILFSKLAGQDTVTDHRDWSVEFAGWSDTGFAAGGGDTSNPAGLVRAIFHRLEDNAASRAAGPRPSPADATVELPVHLDDNGVDLSALLEAFLYGGVGYSQVADDYLDDDASTPGKGLTADHAALDEDELYTPLEHAWDEGLGYFGAAHSFPISDVAGGTLVDDADGDGRIDLTSERTFGAAALLAARDEASSASARTTFATDAWLAFRTGRAILAFADGALGAQQVADLAEQRDLALEAWEAGVAATVVHHINRLLQDVGGAGSDHATYAALAHDFGWAKGLALMFQFSPRSRVSDSDFAALHAALGDAPTFTGDVDAYRTSLREARSILATTFGFASENVGDDDGEGGW